MLSNFQIENQWWGGGKMLELYENVTFELFRNVTLGRNKERRAPFMIGWLKSIKF